MTESSNIRLSVVIPAYNEELRLPHTLSQAIDYLKKQAYRSEIIVVDDGSTDETVQVVHQQSDAPVPLKLLRHPDGANHGKGASVKRGILEATGDFRLFMDADNSTTLNHVERFWPFFDFRFEVVIGSRGLRDSVVDRHQSKTREIAGQIGNWLVQKLAVPGIFDTQAGFKMFTGPAAEDIFQRVTIDKWGFDIELLVIARSLGYQIREVPITWLNALLLVIARSLGYQIREVPITWLNALGSKVTFRSYFEVLGEIRKIQRNLRAGLYK